MLHAKALLFINHRKPQIFELYVLTNDTMRADHDVHRAIPKPFDDLPLLLGRGETTEHLHGHGVVRHALAESIPMLLCKHGGRNQNGDLLAAHHGFESSPNGHLRFPKADIAAEKTVHWLFHFHIPLNLLYGTKLIWGLTIKEGLLELDLPLRIGRMGKTCDGLPFSCGAQHLSGKLLHAAFSLGTRLSPARITQLIELWHAASNAHITRYQMSLSERNEELPFIRIANDDDLFFARAIANLNADEAADAVVRVDDVIPFLHLTNHVPRLTQHLGFIELRSTNPARVLMTSKDLRAGQYS